MKKKSLFSGMMRPRLTRVFSIPSTNLLAVQGEHSFLVAMRLFFFKKKISEFWTHDLLLVPSLSP